MAEKKPTEDSPTLPPLGMDQAIEVCHMDFLNGGADYTVTLKDDPDGSGRKTEYIWAQRNEPLTVEDIAKKYGAGTYRVYLTYRTAERMTNTNFPIVISKKYSEALTKDSASVQPEDRLFRIGDMRAMIQLLKEFNDVVLSHNPPGVQSQHTAQSEIVKQSNDMLLESFKIMRDNQKETFAVVNEQLKIREKAIAQNQIEYEEDEEDEVAELTDDNPAIDNRNSAEKLVDDVFPIVAKYIPDIIRKTPVAAGLAAIAKAHPTFAILQENETALQLLGYKIWSEFGRNEMVAVIEQLGLPTQLIDAVAALVEGMKGA